MNECIAQAIEKLEFLGFSASDIKCIGITNQRETVVCWDKTTGKPLCKTVVWDDARTVGVVREFQKKLDEEGLPFGDNEEDERDPKEGGGYFEAKKEQNGAQALAEKLKNGLGVAEQAKKQGGDDGLPTPTVISDVAISGGKRRRKGKEALVDM
jgi:glycerol kinase